MPGEAPVIEMSRPELGSRVRAPVSVRTPVAVGESPGLTVPDVVVIVPTVSVYVDLGHWDARAKALQGDSGSLLAGFAAKLGEHLRNRASCRGESMA